MEETQMKIRELHERLQGLNSEIETVLNQTFYRENGDLSDLSINRDNAEETLLYEELCQVMDSLSEAQNRIDYLSRPIKETSRLHMNESGIYETARGHSYTSGSNIEALIFDKYYNASRWALTRVEHDGEDYYLVGYRDEAMHGITVRVRE